MAIEALELTDQKWKEWSRALPHPVSSGVGGKGALKDEAYEAQLPQRRYGDDGTHATQKYIPAYHSWPPAGAPFLVARAIGASCLIRWGNAGRQAIRSLVSPHS